MTDTTTLTGQNAPVVLTPAQAAKFLTVSVKTLANWRCHGIGPKYIKAAGVRYLMADLLIWLESKKQNTNVN